MKFGDFFWEVFYSYCLTRSNPWESPRQSRGFTYLIIKPKGASPRPVGAASCRDTVRTWKVLLQKRQEIGIQKKIGGEFGHTEIIGIVRAVWYIYKFHRFRRTGSITRFVKKGFGIR
jgi:hypothetical protein